MMGRRRGGGEAGWGGDEVGRQRWERGDELTGSICSGSMYKSF